MVMVSNGTSQGGRLFDAVAEILLENQGLKEFDQNGKFSSAKPIDHGLINRLRETSTDLKFRADATLERLNCVLPQDQLVELDRSVRAVKGVFDFETKIVDRHGHQALDDLLWAAYAQSGWLTAESIDVIMMGGDLKLIGHLMFNEKIPKEFRAPLGASLLPYLDFDNKLVLATDPDTPPEWLKILAKDSHLAIQVAVAGNIGTPAMTLMNMARTGEIALKRSVANNEKAPEQVLFYLAGHRDEEVRENVAGNTSISHRIMLRLVQDRSEEVLLNLVENENLTPDIILKLARKRSMTVKIAVANAAHTPPEVLLELAKTDDWKLKMAIASNPAAPEEALAMVLEVPDNLTRGELKKVIQLKSVVAAHVNASPDLVIDLAKESSWKIRHGVVKNPAPPEAALRIILEAYKALMLEELDNDKDQIYTLALSTMLSMAEQTNPYSSTPASILVELYRLETPPWDIWMEWGDLKEYLAANDQTPAWILRQLMRAPTQELLEAFALNDNLPPDIAAELPDDYAEFRQMIHEADVEELSEAPFGMDFPDDLHEQVPGFYRALLDLNDPFVDTALAGMSNTPEFALLELMEKEHFDTKIALATNEALPQTSFNRLIELVDRTDSWGTKVVELAITLIKNRTIPVDSLARWVFKSDEVDDLISADIHWQKVAGRIIELDEANKEWAEGRRPQKRARFP